MNASSLADHGHPVHVPGCRDCHELRRRRAVCHGWAFREHAEAEVAAVRAYLVGASPDDLPDLPAAYRHLHRRLP